MRAALKPASAEIFVVESILIAPEGELDVASLGEFRAALSEAASKAADRLVVDLSRLESIDSSVERSLIPAREGVFALLTVGIAGRGVAGFARS